MSTVKVEVNETAAIITISRPKQLNALDEATRLNLAETILAAGKNDDVSSIILTGEGRGFCVGHDLAQVHELDDTYDCVSRTYNPIIAAITGVSKPVIAAVNGPAVGAGMGIALACDHVMMSETSYYACVFGKVGFIPDSGTTFFLARRLGHQFAFDLATTGRKVKAMEAVQLQLANQVFASDELINAALEKAKSYSEESETSLVLTKRLLLQAAESSLQNMIEKEALAQDVCSNTQEHIDRRNAFLNRS